MAFNWTNLINPQLIALIVAGIQSIHGDAKSGADKKTLALESLGLAIGVAGQAVSGDTAVQADAAATAAAAGIEVASGWSSHDTSAIIGASIDAAVAAFKLAGMFGFKKK